MSEEYGTVGGVPVSEDDIAAMVANAEAGFPGVTMRRARPVRPSMGIARRLSILCLFHILSHPKPLSDVAS